jgi:uridylate kinase
MRRVNSSREEGEGLATSSLRRRPIPRSEEETIVLKLSGSLFFSDRFDDVASTIVRVLERKTALRLVLVAGGGKTAREYIEVAGKLGADQASLDEIGIAVSRINARVLAAALGGIAVQRIPKSLGELVEAVELGSPEKRAVVIGGLHPGQSTNAVGALAAEKLKASLFVNATDVAQVYTEDPKKFPDAKPLSSVTPGELGRILGSESMRAGSYDLMDPVALKLVERSKIRTWIIRCDPETIEEVLSKGGPSLGTEIVFRT